MTKNFIVTTTINEPTEATLKFAAMQDWNLVVVGDTKTPHKSYQTLDNIIYLTPEDQEKLSKPLSDSIGWQSIRRRNLGYLYAYRNGADIIATVDDDNIPFEGWGTNLLVGREVEVDLYESQEKVFDPLSVTSCKDLWHRGYPIQLVHSRKSSLLGRRKIKCLVQADLWNGDPDIDAICRITKRPNVKFDYFHPFSTINFTPFNSQNTFIHRDLLPYYMVIPHIGRMDDIWGAYVLQQKFLSEIGPFVVFNNASVFQARNEHDLMVDMQQEMIGYQNTQKLLKSNLGESAPPEASISYNIYRSCFT